MKIDFAYQINTPLPGWQELKAKIKAFEGCITAVSLRQYPLKNLNLTQIQKLVCLLGSDVHSLDLSGSLLNITDPAQICSLFVNSFPKLKMLSLADNQFYKLSLPSWESLLSIIPGSIEALDFQNNLLHNKILDLNNYNFSLTKLNLTNNSLDKITEDTFMYRINFLDLSCNPVRLIPDWRSKNITRLKLTYAELDKMTPHEFRRFCEYLPRSLQALDLQNNNLSALTAEVLREGFSLLPDALIYINLNANQLNEIKGSGLKIALSGLPENIEHVELAENNLSEIKGHGIKVGLSGLPKAVRYISLIKNTLHQLTLEQLSEAFKSLTRKEFIVRVYADENYLCSLSQKDQNFLQRNLPMKVRLILSEQLTIGSERNNFFKSDTVMPSVSTKLERHYVQCLIALKALNQQNLPLELVLQILSYVAPKPVVDSACTFYCSNWVS